MNFLAFLFVAAALILGLVVVVMTWREKPSPAFLLGLGLALCSLGVIVNDTFLKWSHTIHN